MLIITGKEMGAFGFLFSPKFTVRLCVVKKMGVEREGRLQQVFCYRAGMRLEFCIWKRGGRVRVYLWLAWGWFVS